KLCEIELSCDTVVAHNGHFLDYAGSKQYSDTQIFISKVLSKFKFEDLLNPKIRMLLNIITDENRLIIMNTSGKVTKFGNWIKSKGLYYSNNSLIRYNLVDDYYLDSKYDEKSFAEVSRGYTANKFCYLCGLPSSEVELKYDEFVKEYICEECRQTIRY
ncbi:hypothetical protein M0R01_03565, partial [bacterium]|nr:hypothetical protein [bacterium]